MAELIALIALSAISGVLAAHALVRRRYDGALQLGCLIVVLLLSVLAVAFFSWVYDVVQNSR